MIIVIINVRKQKEASLLVNTIDTGLFTILISAHKPSQSQTTVPSLVVSYHQREHTGQREILLFHRKLLYFHQKFYP